MNNMLLISWLYRIKVLIYEFDQKNNFIRRIEADSANITTTKWYLENAKIVDSEGTFVLENSEDSKELFPDNGGSGEVEL